MILISGATKGIGRAIAERFASAGNDVFVIARTRKDLENLQTSWKEQFPGTHLYFFAGDLSTPAVFPKIEEDIGRINRPIRAIVNNVGLYQPGGLLAEEDTFSSL
ncbi:MAG: SDR family NAD(P)-dependent oxidoreductase, partial [Bacteroidota bacterium]